MFGQLNTELSGGMEPASTQAPPPSFNRRRIGNAISIDGIGSPGCINELDRRFEEEQRSWNRRVQGLEEEVNRLRRKGKVDKGNHEDGSRIDMRGEVVINGVKGVE